MRTAGVDVTVKCHLQIVSAYAATGQLDAAEAALEAALGSGEAVPAAAYVAVMAAFAHARNVPRVLHWLRRLQSSGAKLVFGSWACAIEAAHAAGDADAADALFIEADAAGAMAVLYRRILWFKARRGCRILRDAAPASRKAHTTALDLRACGGGVARAAVRTEVAALSARTSKVRYRYVHVNGRTPHQQALAAMVAECAEESGVLQGVPVPDVPGLLVLRRPSPPAE
eukprot:TRINITY_DN6179_c0_g1_i1.p4 TRINITY_DN6179_c0_g1~~TRINITY_DN6179_c0_g1_i1.p4  ORF type:complete len:228 (-),score=70.81 TRINITY_DN6179_c0_g1_i1:246-929(-)